MNLVASGLSLMKSPLIGVSVAQSILIGARSCSFLIVIILFLITNHDLGCRWHHSTRTEVLLKCKRTSARFDVGHKRPENKVWKKTHDGFLNGLSLCTAISHQHVGLLMQDVEWLSDVPRTRRTAPPDSL